MKILLINKFLFPKGGAAISTLKTGSLLKTKGNKVSFWGMKDPRNPLFPYNKYFVSNIDFNGKISLTKKFKAVFRILYSIEAKKKIKQLIEIEKPDIVHLNNFAHQISPSILSVFKKQNIPIVMTIRDFKLVCPYWYLLKNGKPCEKCKHGRYYWCVINKCTKNSFLKSLINTIEMYLHHKILHIYDLIDVFISPSIFLKKKIIELGFNKEINFLPNFINIKEYTPKFEPGKKSICYFGRLSEEKGLFTLLEAIKNIDIRLKIIGEGQLEERLKAKVKNDKINNIDFLGYKTDNNLSKEIKDSMFIVIPSECYENNPRSILEAFALGKPVIGSKSGGIPELVNHGNTGLIFEPGNFADLRNKIIRLINDPDRIKEMGINARKFVEEMYNPEDHYQKLIKIYRDAIRKKK